MFPDLGYYQDMALMALSGFNFQWSVFNLFSNPQEDLRFIALGFGLIGSAVILLTPRYQSWSVIGSFLLLVVIMLIGPYGPPGNGLFFSTLPADHFEVKFAPQAFARWRHVEETQAAAGSGVIDDTGAKTIGEVTRLEENAVPGHQFPKGFTPQLVVMHFLTKIEKAIVSSLCELDASGRCISLVKDTASHAQVHQRTGETTRNPTIQYYKNVFDNICAGHSELSFRRYDQTEAQRHPNLAFTFFNLEQVHQLNHMYYDLKEQNQNAQILPVRAEPLVPGGVEFFNSDQEKQQAIQGIQNTAGNDGPFIDALTGANNESLINDPDVNALYLDHPFVNDAVADAWIPTVAKQWEIAHTNRILANKNYPVGLYKEDGGAGSLSGVWTMAEVEEYVNNRQKYTDEIGTLFGSTDANVQKMTQLPVAIRMPDVTAANPYAPVVSERITNCAEFHRFMVNDLITFIARESRLVEEQLAENTCENINLNNFKIALASPEADTQFRIREIAEKIKAQNPGISDKQLCEQVREKILPNKRIIEKMQAVTADSNFSWFADLFADVGEFLLNIFLMIAGFFVGVGAQIFIKVMHILIAYGMALVIMVTPFIYMMGLLIPAWAPQILLVPIVGVVYFKAVSIAFLLIDATVDAMAATTEVNGEELSWMAENLFVFFAAAAYVATFGITAFLLFGLGNAASLARMGASLDTIGNKLADKGVDLNKTAGKAAGAVAVPLIPGAVGAMAAKGFLGSGPVSGAISGVVGGGAGGAGGGAAEIAGKALKSTVDEIKEAHKPASPIAPGGSPSENPAAVARDQGTAVASGTVDADVSATSDGENPVAVPREQQSAGGSSGAGVTGTSEALADIGSDSKNIPGLGKATFWRQYKEVFGRTATSIPGIGPMIEELTNSRRDGIAMRNTIGGLAQDGSIGAGGAVKAYEERLKGSKYLKSIQKEAGVVADGEEYLQSTRSPGAMAQAARAGAIEKARSTNVAGQTETRRQQAGIDRMAGASEEVDVQVGTLKAREIVGKVRGQMGSELMGRIAESRAIAQVRRDFDSSMEDIAKSSGHSAASKTGEFEYDGSIYKPNDSALDHFAGKLKDQIAETHMDSGMNADDARNIAHGQGTAVVNELMLLAGKNNEKGIDFTANSVMGRDGKVAREYIVSQDRLREAIAKTKASVSIEKLATKEGNINYLGDKEKDGKSYFAFGSGGRAVGSKGRGSSSSGGGGPQQPTPPGYTRTAGGFLLRDNIRGED